MFDTEQVKDRGMEIVPSHWIVDRFPADFICLTVTGARS